MPYSKNTVACIVSMSHSIQPIMVSMNDETVIYQAPGLKIYTKNGHLIADFNKRTDHKDNGTE